MSTFKSWARAHLRPLFVGTCSLLMMLGILGVVASLATSGPTEDPEAVAAVKENLTAQRDTAEQELIEAQARLQDELGGADSERIERDQTLVRSFVLDLAAISNTSRDVHAEQVSLDGRYEALDANSRVLTEFVPEWMATTKGTTYVLGDLRSDVASISGLDYRYLATARLDPVDGEGSVQYLLVSVTTASDGTITVVEAYRTGDHTHRR